MMADIGPEGTAYNGDDALLFGEYGDWSLPLSEICSAAKTIPYEILCQISARVPRIYVS